MSDITLRLVKGSPLTNQEVDDNFANLNTDKYQAGDSASFQDVTLDNMTGPITWNTDDGALDIPLNAQVTLQAGQEFVFYAKATEAIANGDVVMFAGAQGGHLLIAKCDMGAAGFDPSHIVGVSTQSFAINDFGYVTSKGKVRSLDTSGFTEGDILYVDPTTAGGFTATKPAPPNHIVQVAAVTRSHATQGTVLTRVSHMPDTDEVPEGSTNLYFTDARAVSAIKADGDWNASNWDTAYGWGDHSTEGYLTSFTETDPTVPSHVKSITTTNISNWNTAYGWGDHSTQNYATQTYVNNAVSNLVDSSPSTLDTLNELAAALGDDPNFATTVSNSIGTKWTQNNTKISNWDTAYGWGNHASAGYLTSYSETDTLQSVTTRGATTNRNITTTGKLTVEDNVLEVGNKSADNYVEISQHSTATDFGFTFQHSNASLFRNLQGGTNQVLALGDVDPTADTTLLGVSILKDGSYYKRLNLLGNGTMYIGSGTDRVFADNYHPNADKWTTARTNTVTLTGDLSGSGSATVDGTGNWTVSVNASVLNNSHSHDNYVDQLSQTSSPNYQQSSSRRVDPNSSNPTNEHYAVSTFGNETNVVGQLATHFVDGQAYTRGHNSGWSTWRKQWDSLNDGSGSGLDADLLDGLHASSFWQNSGSWRGIHTDKTRVSGISYGGGEVWFGYTGGKGYVIADGEFYANEGNSRVFHDTYHPNADKWTTARTHTVTLTGDVSGTASQSVDGTGNKSWILNTAVADDSHFHHRLDSTDDRDVKPNTSGVGSGVQAIKPFFTSLGGMTGSANTDYQDLLVLDTYSDTSGGNANAITMDKSDGSMRIWNAGQNASSWGTGQRVFADNYHPNADKWTTARSHTVTLTGDVTGSATQSVDGTGNRTWSIATNVKEPASGNWWNAGHPVVATDGVMEIGKYIDFHNTSSATSDFTARITNNGSHLYTTGRWYVNNNQRVFADDYHPNADKWTTARTITLGGDLSGSVSLDGSANVTLSAQVTNNSHDHTRLSGFANQTEYDLIRAGNLNGLCFKARWDGSTGNRYWDMGYVDGYGTFTSGLKVYNGGALTYKGNTVFHDAYHPNADKWTTARSHTVTLTGDVTGSATQSVDGTGNKTWTVSTAVANNSHSHNNYLNKYSELSSGDLNTFTANESGAYFANGSYSSVSNIPYANYFTMLHLRNPYSDVNSGSNSLDRAAQLWFGDTPGRAYWRPYQGSSTGWHGWERIWTSANDGSGSGLDADLLDGNHASAFATSGHGHTGLSSNGWGGITSSTSSGYIDFGPANSGHAHIYTDRPNFYFNKQLVVLGNGVWNSGNDGSGSGLDADLLDGVQGSSFLRSDANDTASGQYNFTKVNDHAIQVGTIRGRAVGSQSGQYIHMYDRVHIGSPNGWGSNPAPSYGLSTHGGAEFCQGTGSVKVGDNIAQTHGGLQILRNGGVPSSSGYSVGNGAHIEIYANNNPVLGFHNSGNSACSLYEDGGDLYLTRWNGTATGSRLWHSNNDGSGSGLDADLLDGQHASAFLLKTGGTISGTLTLQTTNDAQLYLNGNGSTWAGIAWTDVNSTDYMWYRGATGTFAIGGGGSSVSGKKLHIDGGTTIGANLDGTIAPSNGLKVEGEIHDNQGGVFSSYTHSGSDFVNGTLVQTDIPATSASGASYVLEVTGKSYSSSPPFSFIAQGYLYNSTIISHSGVNLSGHGPSYIKAMEYNGNLCFWWPRISYWNSFEVRVRDAGGSSVNRVTSIGNATEPSATKKVQTNIVKTWNSGNDGSGSGLDADLLDGQQGSYYYPASNPNGYTSNTGNVREGGTSFNGEYPVVVRTSANTIYSDTNIRFRGSDSRLSVDGSVVIAGNTAWHAGNDGSGSGLDADLLDGIDSTRFTKLTSQVSSGDFNTVFNTGTAFRTQISQVANITGGSYSNNPTGVYTYGSVLNWRAENSTFQLYTSHTGDLVYRTGWNNDGYSGWRRVLNTGYYGAAWTSGNDGSGSGLDADLLDGQHASAFASASHSHSNYLTTTGKAADSNLLDGIDSSRVVYGAGAYKSNSTSTFHNNVSGFHFYSGATNAPTAEWYNWITCRGNSWGNSDEYSFQLAHNFWNDNIYVRRTQSGTERTWHKMWTAGNDGSGSGLDADLLDGVQGSSYMRTTSETNLNMNAYDITDVNSLSVQGAITAGGNITAYSDSRLKDNVETLDGSKVYEMRGVSFTKDGVLGSGVIAQELEKVAPELVMTNDDEMQTKSVAYGNVVGYLIEAIKEQQTQLNELQAQIKSLKEK